jgi:hypothetical protein
MVDGPDDNRRSWRRRFVLFGLEMGVNEYRSCRGREVRYSLAHREP